MDYEQKFKKLTEELRSTASLRPQCRKPTKIDTERLQAIRKARLEKFKPLDPYRY